MQSLIPIGQSSNQNEEPTKNLPLLQCIGSGSLATIYIAHGGACAFKVVNDPENAEILENEYWVLTDVHNNCSLGSFFELPRPYSFYNPATGAFSARKLRITDKTFRFTEITNASYVMDRLFALPVVLGDLIRNLYYPTSFKTANFPTLCRLYFGKVMDVRPYDPKAQQVHPFNTMDFPLDIRRYEVLDTFHGLPELHEVIAGMGDMLARIHWLGDCDARNIEWVMSGDGYGEEVSFSVIDFEKTRPWGKTLEGVDMLVTAFMQNEPYYPRPRPEDPYYQTFKTAYLAAYPPKQATINVALAFLRAIEHEQARRDTEFTTHQ